MSMRESVISHLIKPEDLQHHGTLFAGQMAKWLVEACFVAASRLVGRPEDVVCVQIHGINFTRPVHNGDIIEIRSRVAFTGATSITVYGAAAVNEETQTVVSGMTTFVTVDKDGTPYQHGIVLPEDYIAKNRDIYNQAIEIRRQKGR